MSLLMFRQSPEAVHLVTDTLETTVGGDPHSLVTKCGIVPHLDLVVAGTGVAAVSERWRKMVHDLVLCRDIDMLDVHAPKALRKVWIELVAENPTDLLTETATIYHLGLANVRVSTSATSIGPRMISSPSRCPQVSESSRNPIPLSRRRRTRYRR